ncbi:MAG: acyl carrier protein [Coriobacteriales bacterium]|jgi:acyl carrier protein|nr:acyl carrier protein [Coriobacteriales bacterium]
MAEETIGIVGRILVEQLNIDEATVTAEASIADDLGADSLDAVELIMSLEDEFGIEIEPGKAEELKTVGDIVALVDELKA